MFRSIAALALSCLSVTFAYGQSPRFVDIALHPARRLRRGLWVSTTRSWGMHLPKVLWCRSRPDGAKVSRLSKEARLRP
jgi:hypothetical protein